MTQDELHKILNYDLKTGDFFWKIKPAKNIGIGQKAGCKKTNQYLSVRYKSKQYGAHRLAWLYVYGDMPGMVDHINGNSLDNRIENLRKCNKSENAQNSKRSVCNSSGSKNVCWDKNRNKWSVIVRVNGIKKSFGRFDDLELADLVAVEARNKYHGNFARHF
jgi:hypothetical protein